MTTSYPVPFASEEPLGSVTRVLALAEGDGVDVKHTPSHNRTPKLKSIAG